MTERAGDATRTRAELWRPVRLTLERLAAADPRFRRFGAARHRYRLRPPLAEARLAELERAAQRRLPEDYRDFLLELGDGGAGPYYGLLPLDQPAQRAQLAGPCALGEAPAAGPLAPWRGVVALGHLGCGYLAYLILSGPRRGQVWLDASASGVVTCIAPHFLAFYTDWLAALEDARWPPAYVSPGTCALAHGLSDYLAHVERRRHLAPGSLGGEELREAWAALGPGAVQVVAEASRSPLLPSSAPVDPCVACEQLLEGLRGQGLAREAVAAGHPVGEWPEVQVK